MIMIKLIMFSRNGARLIEEICTFLVDKFGIDFSWGQRPELLTYANSIVKYMLQCNNCRRQYAITSWRQCQTSRRVHECQQLVRRSESSLRLCQKIVCNYVNRQSVTVWELIVILRSRSATHGGYSIETTELEGEKDLLRYTKCYQSR